MMEPLYRKISLRLIPVLFICYILAYLDRVNVGFAKLSMGNELWFSDEVFALGSGIFFIGYFLFEVPANLLMQRLGARLWMTRIMITWGICSALCALSSDPAHFYFFRFLLGLAEAGFFPGVILYLTYWYPQYYRARMVALFMSAIALAGIVGSPVSGYILSAMQDYGSLKPWQWLFIMEGIPSVLFGLALPWLLTDGPKKASWLTDQEKKSVLDRLELERVQSKAKVHSVGAALRSPEVWLLALVYFSITLGLYGISFWLPQILKTRITTDPIMIGMLAAIPWLCAAAGMYAYGRHSDLRQERRYHLLFVAVLGMLSFVGAGIFMDAPVVLMICISLATTCVMCSMAVFWPLPSALLSGVGAAAGIAWINSIGNLAGYISPELFVWLRDVYSGNAALIAIGMTMMVGGLISFILFRPAR